MSFGTITFTNKGRALQAKAIAGATLHFNRIGVGDGQLSGQAAGDLSALIHEVQSLEISKLVTMPGGKAKIGGVLTNQGLAAGFYWRELGVYAQDPDLGEILYCYGNAGALAEYIPAQGGSQILEKQVNVITIIGAAQNVTASIASGIYVTVDDAGEAAYKDIDVAGGVASHEAVTEIERTISSGAVQSPAIGFGYNRIHIPEVATSPKIEFTGFDYVNLLGKDGNCESIAPWSGYQATLSLDSANKMFGSKGIKITSTDASGGNMYQLKSNIINIDTNKYYLFSAYLKNGNAATVVIQANPAVTSSSVTSTTNFVRVAIKLTPVQMANINDFNVNVGGSSGKYAYADGIMLNEISAADYALTPDQLMAKYPYVDSYATLQNPMFENRRGNLVRNGNCEEGIGYWSSPSGATLTVNEGKFVFTVDQWEGFIQRIKVKSNTDYYIKSNVSGTGAEVIITDPDGFNIGIGYMNSTFNTGAYTEIAVLMRNGAEGSNKITVDSIMLIEGTEAPEEYKSCDLQRFVVEGQFTKDDKVKIENGKVMGQLLWKHKTLYGKDYDWKYYGSGVGFKTIGIPLSTFPGAYLVSSIGNTLVKPDGLLAKEGPVSSGIIDNFNLTTAAGGFIHNLSNIYSGFVNGIEPDNNEIKAFMNGWQALTTNIANTRYTSWIKVGSSVSQKSTDITLYPSGTVTTLTVATTAGAENLTVQDSTIFKIGDLIYVYGGGGLTITGIAGNVLTVRGTVLAFPSGQVVLRADNPDSGDTRILQYCIANIAPGYEGYRLHYKLLNPEPVTDVNTPVHGEIWDLIPGDNYVYVDSGIVLGEIVNPTTPSTGDNGFRYVNSIALNTYSPVKNKVDGQIMVYKNQGYDNLWIHATDGNAYGNDRITIAVANYDAYATYSVDYQILKTLHAQVFGSLSLSYKQSILSTLESHGKALEQKQQHDNALDNIVDSKLYEQGQWRTTGRAMIVQYSANAQAGILLHIPYMVKKNIVPIVTLKNVIINVYDSHGVGTLLNLATDFAVRPIPISISHIGFEFYCIINVSEATQAFNGYDVSFNWEARQK